MLDAGKILVNCLAALTLALSACARAHDIPTDVLVIAYVKPEGQRLRLLVRVPMKALRDVDYPRRGAGLLDLARADASLANAATLWISDELELYEGLNGNESRLGPPRLIDARVSLESDKSFASYEQALAHLAGERLPGAMDLYWEQGLLDALFEYPIGSDRADFSIRPRLERLGARTTIALRFLPPVGTVRAFELHGDPGLVRLDPRWLQAASRFVELGFLHILEGADHLLFLLCLVIPFRRLGQLVWIVTSFTVAHSITLIASAYGLGPGGLWFPPLIETLIAISILYMAIENVLGSSVGRRWIVTFGFGLVHGFAFSYALRESLQFAGSHLLTSLLAFNVGIELGQLLVLVLLVPALNLLFRRAAVERTGTIVLSLIAGHTAWHWMTERAERLSRFPWPDAAQLASAVRLLMLLLVLGGLAWVARAALRRRRDRQGQARNGG
ncbi:MAG TPA: HupE/UreJ family protein [Burkholderiales bacterium]|nr:HupE/UreJ family protein [Burkholderiales bacterium]